MPPLLVHCSNRRDAVIVMRDKRVPHRTAGAQPIVPWHVVEPQEVLVRHALQVREAAADFRCVLRYSVAAVRSAVEADAGPTRLMIVCRVPQRSGLVVDAEPRT